MRSEDGKIVFFSYFTKKFLQQSDDVYKAWQMEVNF